MIIVIVGLPASGKTTAVEVCGEIGFSTVTSGDVIRDEIKKRGLPYNKETDREVASWFHSGGREKLLIKRVLDKADGDKIAIEGLRSFDQIGELEKQTGEKPVIIGISADFDVRVNRAERRHRFADNKEEYIRQRDAIEANRGEKKIMETADYKIDNSDLSFEEFKQNVRLLVEKIMEEKAKI